MTLPTVVLHGAEVDREITDVFVAGGHVAAMGSHLAVKADLEVDCGGGALIHGLHDHHIHLLALAAAAKSLHLGPPAVRTREDLAHQLQHAASRTTPGQWLRGVGYHESVAGELHRYELDALAPANPLKIQHRSGALWMLNSHALVALGLDSLDGRLSRMDESVRQGTQFPDLEDIGRQLARVGVTGVTDATPFQTGKAIEFIGNASASGVLPQRVTVTGGVELAATIPLSGVAWGPVKLVIPDHDLPEIDAVACDIAAAHRFGRSVAVHCVTEMALAIALAAWHGAGVAVGDRIEHASVVPSAAIAEIARLGLTVVTQPGLVSERGDEYLKDVAAKAQADLYRCASLLASGIAVGGSTDAPYTSLDPWKAMRGAVERRSPSGQLVNAAEAVTAERALSLFSGDAGKPGGPARRLTVGGRADLCLLDAPLDTVCGDLDSRHVRATVCDGRVFCYD